MTTSEPLLPLDLPQTELLLQFPTPRANKWGLPDSHGSTAAFNQPAVLISSAAGSPARTSALQETAQALRASAAAYGRSTPELLARFDPDTSSWRTSQLCLDGDLTEFSETWPRSGLVVAGTVSLPLPSGHRIVEIESGS
jgi:hypothetical protein